MAEPISQVVTSMPRARFVALMALFLGPAVAVYTLFSIYPLIATMGLSTYTSDSGGEYHFAGLANFVTLLTELVLVEAVLERGQKQPHLLLRAHGCPESHRDRACRPLEPAWP